MASEILSPAFFPLENSYCLEEHEHGWGGGTRTGKEQLLNCQTELTNNHQNGFWEPTSCKVSVLGCDSTGRMGALKQ